MAKIVRAGAAFDDPKVSPVVRQTLLHWGYELSSSDFEVEAARYRKTGRAYLVPAEKPKAAGKGAKRPSADSDEEEEEGGGAGGGEAAAAAGSASGPETKRRRK